MLEARIKFRENDFRLLPGLLKISGGKDYIFSFLFICTPTNASFLALRWDFGFRRNLSDLEVGELLSLFSQLDIILVSSRQDERRWMLEAWGKFLANPIESSCWIDPSLPQFIPSSVI